MRFLVQTDVATTVDWSSSNTPQQGSREWQHSLNECLTPLDSRRGLLKGKSLNLGFMFRCCDFMSHVWVQTKQYWAFLSICHQPCSLNRNLFFIRVHRHYYVAINLQSFDKFTILWQPGGVRLITAPPLAVVCNCTFICRAEQFNGILNWKLSAVMLLTVRTLVVVAADIVNIHVGFFDSRWPISIIHIMFCGYLVLWDWIINLSFPGIPAAGTGACSTRNSSVADTGWVVTAMLIYQAPAVSGLLLLFRLFSVLHVECLSFDLQDSK